MELPTDIWSEILTYTDNSIRNQLYEMNINELIDTQSTIRSLINIRCNQLKSQLKCNDVIKISITDGLGITEYHKYAIITSLAYINNRPNSIRVICGLLCDTNTNLGNFETNNYITEIIDLERWSVKVIHRACDVINNNREIAKQTEKYDVIEFTQDLFIKQHIHTPRQYAIVIKKIKNNTIIIISSFNLCIYKISTKDVLNIVDLNNPTTGYEQELFTKCKLVIELRKQILRQRPRA